MDLLSQAVEEYENLQAAKNVISTNESCETDHEKQKQSDETDKKSEDAEKNFNKTNSLNNENVKLSKSNDNEWHTVGIFMEQSATVDSFIQNSVYQWSEQEITAENLPNLTKFPRIPLEAGAAYRFRIRAINALGASEWSEVSSFKTCLPGFPGAPSSIKISKSVEGAQLTWEPPPSCLNSDEIIEYSVYLAVKPGRDKDGKANVRAPTQLAFVRVYVGANNYCTVAHSSLTAAHVDCSNKPAIIFRIAARNEKGYGPATQVRWLQDSIQSAASSTRNPASLLSPKRSSATDQMNGSSPNKRARTNSVRSIETSDF